MSRDSKNNTTLFVIIGIVALAIGYVLGAAIGWPKDDGYSQWAGTYTNDTWNGNQRVSLVLNKDGTCKRPKMESSPCTYEVRDGYVYFNGESESTTAIGKDGIVYSNAAFTKLK